MPILTPTPEGDGESGGAPLGWPDVAQIKALADALLQAPPGTPHAQPISAPSQAALNAPRPSFGASFGEIPAVGATNMDGGTGGFDAPHVPPAAAPSAAALQTPRPGFPGIGATGFELPAPVEQSGLGALPQALAEFLKLVPDDRRAPAPGAPPEAAPSSPEGGYAFLREAKGPDARPYASEEAFHREVGHGPSHGAGRQDGAAPPAARAPASPRAPAPGFAQPEISADLAPDLNRSLDRGHRIFDVGSIRKDFPILAERVHGKPLVWFDNAATTQKPQAVIDRLAYFYAHENSNIHRAAHSIAARADEAYDKARDTVGRFLGAGDAGEVVFVRGTTEAINLIAKSWGRANIREGDEILVTHLEHHANIVPWRQLCLEVGAKLKVAPVDDDANLLVEEFERLIGPRTKLVAFTQVANAVGTVTPVETLTAIAKRHGATVLVDGAQSVSHMPVNVQEIGCDFFVFSGHKIFGPTGIGAVWGRKAIWEKTPPWQGGGNMIADVTFERVIYQPPPSRFEAGTGNIADAVGLATALDYVERIGRPAIARYEHDLLVYATGRMLEVPGLKLIGRAKEKASVLSFTLEGWETRAVGQELDKEGIAVRAGHHCAQPILRRLGLETTVRPSLAFYNTCEEVDLMVETLKRLQRGRRR